MIESNVPCANNVKGTWAGSGKVAPSTSTSRLHRIKKCFGIGGANLEYHTMPRQWFRAERINRLSNGHRCCTASGTTCPSAALGKAIPRMVQTVGAMSVMLVRRSTSPGATPLPKKITGTWVS